MLRRAPPPQEKELDRAHTVSQRQKPPDDRRDSHSAESTTRAIASSQQIRALGAPAGAGCTTFSCRMHERSGTRAHRERCRMRRSVSSPACNSRPLPGTSVSRVGACREGPTTFGAGPRRRIRAPRHVGGAAGCLIACQSYTRYRMTRPTNVQRRRAWSNRKATAGPRTTARESQLLVTDRRTPTVRTARAITTRRNFEAGGR